MIDAISVLLVDDEDDFVTTLAERLELRGFDAQVANDGEAALASVLRAAPQVMVLDLKMPGMSGLEVLRRSLAEAPDIRVIMLTGHGSETDRDEAMRIGAYSYLQKPVDIDSLTSLINEAVASTV